MTSLRLPRPSASGRRPRRRAALATGLVGVLALGGAAAATANAHKTVVLDVDGRTTDVSTFAGTVGSVLDAHGVEVGERDVVAPSPDAALAEGSEIVVRHARPVTVLSDGAEEQVWTTALAADEALAGLSARGSDVRLLASRSLDSGRANLSLRLTGDDPVDVVVDGQTLHVEDGTQSLESLLEELDVTVGPLDRVQVHRAPVEGGADGASRLTVVVQRVAAQEVPTVTEVPFERVTEQTADLYTGERETAVAGVAGERTAVHRVVTVDGVEESRMLLSDGVTREPVTEVVRVGTKARPAPKPAPKPAAAPAPAQRASGGGSSSGGSAGGGGGGVVTGDVWARLAACESGGNPSIVSRNGLYHGLYQFSVATWRAVGGSGLPSQASPAEQTQRAQILQARSGWGQWPACSRKLGLR